MVPRDELEPWSAQGPRRWRRGLLYAGAAATVVAGLYLALQPASRSVAVDFELPRLSGEGRLSDDDLRGSPVVINFFASWCAPCREEAPILERVWKRYRGEGVRFVGVNIQDRREPARAFVADYGITFPVVTDYDQDLALDLGVFGLPQTFFVDHSGRLFATESGEQVGARGDTTVLGAISEAVLVRNIEEMLAARDG